MLPLLAQHGAFLAGWTLGDILIAVIVVAAVIIITCIVLKAMGVVLPDWFVKILLVIAVAVVGILAIRFVLSF